MGPANGWMPPVRAPRKPLHRRPGCLGSIAVVVLAITVGVWGFRNGYGPLADRNVMYTSAQAEAHFDDAMRAATAAISPAVSLDKPTYYVLRGNRLGDGEATNISTVFQSTAVRTRISPDKLPLLLDQVAKAWQPLDVDPVKRSGPQGSTVAELDAVTRDLVELSLIAEEPPTPGPHAYVDVQFSMSLYGVHYQPAHDYGLTSSQTGLAVATLDDPYWSH
jgi:hypothetical protein